MPQEPDWNTPSGFDETISSGLPAPFAAEPDPGTLTRQVPDIADGQHAWRARHDGVAEPPVRDYLTDAGYRMPGYRPSVRPRNAGALPRDFAVRWDRPEPARGDPPWAEVTRAQVTRGNGTRPGAARGNGTRGGARHGNGAAAGAPLGNGSGAGAILGNGTGAGAARGDADRRDVIQGNVSRAYTNGAEPARGGRTRGELPVRADVTGARSRSPVRSDGEARAARSGGIEHGQRWERRRRHMTGTQRLGGLLIAAACIGTVAWYVPKVVASDSRTLTGTVTSTGVVDLNFALPGRINKIDVHMGEHVAKGEMLASESDPATWADVKADKAAIAADKAKLAELMATPGSQQAEIAATHAQLDKDEAQLDTDQANLIGTRIVAAQAGTVVAVNGSPGEMVSPLGIRDYTSDSGTTMVGDAPEFSLLPEGPQSSVRATGAPTELPVVALRVSDSWEVAILVPENSISEVRPGEAVTISVPSAHLTGVPGRIQEVLPTPQATSQGTAYEAIVTVFGHQARAPFNGMSADVELGSS
jgi:multidrug efflux pump subunit AcrA (membrane-fusion protein)